MGAKQTDEIIKIRILELEDKLMDVIVISNNYDNIPVPIFEGEMGEILKEIEYLDSLIK